MEGLQGLPQGLAGQMGGVSSEQARQMQQQQQQQAAQEDQRKQMLLAVLDNGARSRLSSVALVKPERAKMVEKYAAKRAELKAIIANVIFSIILVEFWRKQREWKLGSCSGDQNQA